MRRVLLYFNVDIYFQPTALTLSRGGSVCKLSSDISYSVTNISAWNGEKIILWFIFFLPTCFFLCVCLFCEKNISAVILWSTWLPYWNPCVKYCKTILVKSKERTVTQLQSYKSEFVDVKMYPSCSPSITKVCCYKVYQSCLLSVASS